MRLFARWCVAVVGSVAAFLASWWICTRLSGLDEGVSLGVASAAASIALAPLTWWATRSGRSEPTEKPGPAVGPTVTVTDSARVSGVATASDSPHGLAVGDNSGLVIGSGVVMTKPVFHVTKSERDSGLGRGHGSFALEEQRIVVGDIPHEPPAYQSRNDLQAELDTEGAPIVRALTGMRGVGKTHAAAAYARARIADGWRLVAWIHAEDDGAVLGGLRAVAAELGIDNAGRDSASIGRAVRHRLETDGDRCVLVFDNAADPDALRPFVPAVGGARVLITSTRQSMGHLGVGVQVDEFSPEEALAFLATRTGRHDIEGALALSQELGCLPLALAQASAVIAEQHLDYDTYLDRLRNKPVEKLLGRVEAGQYPHGLAAAVLISLDSVRSDDSSGICGAVMDLISVLSSAGVPRRLLYAAGQCSVLGIPPRTVLPDEVDEALGRLARSSMLAFSVDGGAVSAHRLVTRVVREQLARDGHLTPACAAAAIVLDAICPPTWQARLDRRVVRDLVQQIMALYEHSAPAREESAEQLTGTLLDLRMWALSFMNNLRDGAAQAVLIGEPLLTDAERALGAEHFKTLNTGNDLATAYRASGRLTIFNFGS